MSDSENAELHYPMTMKMEVADKYPTLRLRGYDDHFDYNRKYAYMLQTDFRDIKVETDGEKLLLYSGKPRYSMDGHHDFCCLEGGGNGRGRWVVANLCRDPKQA